MKLLVSIFGLYCLALVLTSAGGYIASIYSNSPEGTLTVGTVHATSGLPVEVPITLETEVSIRGVFLHLAYNGDLLEYDHIRLGPNFSQSWQVFSNELTPGNLRVITLSFEGDDFVPDSDPILVAAFKTSPYVTDGEIPISITLSNVANSSLGLLNIATVSGAVNIVGSPWLPVPAI